MSTISTSLCTTLGVLACAAPARIAAGEPLRNAAAGYEVEVLVNGVPAPTFFHAGQAYVMGQAGDRYVLRVRNHTDRRIEAVASVDGRDVVDGRPADFRKRGYLVPAWGSADIDGWRLSQHQAAAFRFSSVADSYAARTGSAREVGVIGVAVFPERIYRPRPLPRGPYTPYPTPPYPYPSYEDRLEGRDDGRYFGLGKDKSAPAEQKSGDTAAEAESRAPAAPSAARESAPLADATGAPPPALGGRARKSMPPESRPGLGTEFGETVGSQVHEVAFVRADSSRPQVVLGVRYNDHAGLVAMGVDVDGYHGYRPDDTYLRHTADPFPVSARRFSAPPPGWRRW